MVSDVHIMNERRRDRGVIAGTKCELWNGQDSGTGSKVRAESTEGVIEVAEWLGVHV